MSYLVGRFITEEGKQNFKNYKYVSGEYSSTDLLLNPFWEWTTELFPMWMAPNLITFMGLLAAVLPCMLMLYYDLGKAYLSTSQPLPEYTYLLVAIGTFVYQTLDSVDGKQARRTGSSSPLGQLFDHGCDFVCWVFSIIGVIAFLELGLCFNGVLAIYSTIGPFFFFNLLEYYSGVYHYVVGGIDGTSSQMLVIFLYLLPFIFGANVYQSKISEILPFMPGSLIEGFLLKDAVILIAVYIGVVCSIPLIFKTFSSIKEPYLKLIAALQTIQHLAIYVCLYMVDPTIPFIKENASLVYLLFGMLFALGNFKLIVCHMAKMQFEIVCFELLLFVPYFYFQSHYDGSKQSEDNIKLAFHATFLVMFIIVARFTQTSITQMTQYLGISCFTIENKKKTS
ncbi:unnamed protein product [Moneuplotes crassus]|uniref:Ethanolaminephosphotransferase n=1 Tax=Euplotes crassus TaxID=5936 RepID=A0AAD1XDS7_EUPCR|nr:unnamed protein product [Moneuplotes crassus]